MELLLASTTAKLVASSITYPHEVVRARLQDSRSSPFPLSTCDSSSGSSNGGGSSGSNNSNQTRCITTTTGTTTTNSTSNIHTTIRNTTTASSKTGIISIVQDIIKKEGFFALWSGLRVSMFRIVPATASTFLAYEYISRYLREHSQL